MEVPSKELDECCGEFDIFLWRLRFSSEEK